MMNNKLNIKNSCVFYYQHSDNNSLCDYLFLQKIAKQLAAELNTISTHLNENNIQDELTKYIHPIVLILSPFSGVRLNNNNDLKNVFLFGSEPDIFHDDGIQQLISYPHAFFMLCSADDPDEQFELLTSNKNAESLLPLKYSIIGLKKYGNHDKIEIPPISIIELLARKALYDPTGIRNYINDSLKNSNNNGRGKFALVLEDDLKTADELAYFLYRLGFSVLALNSERDVSIIHNSEFYKKSILLNLFDAEIINENYNYQKGFTLLKTYLYSNFETDCNNKINILLTSYQMDKKTILSNACATENELCIITKIDKPVVDQYHLQMLIKHVANKLNKPIIEISHRKQSDSEAHKRETSIYRSISHRFTTQLHNNDFHSLINHWDAAKLQAGNDGNECLSMYLIVNQREILKFHTLPIAKIYKKIWYDRFDEINSFCRTAFHKGMETQSYLHEYKIARKMYSISIENSLPFSIQSLIRSKSRWIIVKIKFLNYRLFRKYGLPVANYLHRHKPSVTTLKISGAINIIFNPLIKAIKLFFDVILLMLGTVALFINSYCFRGSARRLSIAWFITAIIFYFIYQQFGNVCFDKGEQIGKLDVSARALVATFSGAFGQGVQDNIPICFQSVNSHHQDIFTTLQITHNIISYIMLLVLVDIFTQKSKEV